MASKKWGRGFTGMMVIPAIIMTPVWLLQGVFEQGRKLTNPKNIGVKSPVRGTKRRTGAKGNTRKRKPNGQFKVKTTIAGVITRYGDRVHGRNGAGHQGFLPPASPRKLSM